MKIPPCRVMANALEAALEESQAEDDDQQDSKGVLGAVEGRLQHLSRTLQANTGDNIVWLDLAFCEQLDSAALGRLSQCTPGLKRISLAGCQLVTDKGTAYECVCMYVCLLLLHMPFFVPTLRV
jgi:hypothetical protein